MKTTIELTKTTRAAIKFAALATNKRSSLPILENVHCYANGAFEVSGTDLDVTTICRVPCQSTIDGKVTLPARAMLDLIASKAAAVEFSADDKNIVTLASGGNSRAVYGLASDEFPQLPPMPGIHPSAGKLTRLEFNAGEFIAALKSVAMAQSTDESRYILNGVCIEFGAETVAVIATDGRRLHQTSLARSLPDLELKAKIDAALAVVETRKTEHAAAVVEFPSPVGVIENMPQVENALNRLNEARGELAALYNAGQIIIHAKTVALICKLPMDKKQPGTLALSAWIVKSSAKDVADDVYCRVDYVNFSIISKTIDGNYPNYRQVIPKNSLHRITVPCAEFAETVETAGKGCTKKSNSVKLCFTSNLLTVTSKAPEIGEIAVKMPVNFKWQDANGADRDFAIAFNPRYLMDAAAGYIAAGHCEMILEFCDELSPVKIVSSVGGLSVVVMPMRLS